MSSIDNYYLLLALMHGVPADIILLLILICTPIRLVRLELRRPLPRRRGGSFGFTLAGIFVAFAVTIATVYVGLTVMPLFAFITGWAEGYLLNAATAETAGSMVPSRASTPFVFRRVMA
jgi:hypothetical protein